LINFVQKSNISAGIRQESKDLCSVLSRKIIGFLVPANHVAFRSGQPGVIKTDALKEANSPYLKALVSGGMPLNKLKAMRMYTSAIAKVAFRSICKNKLKKTLLVLSLI